MDAAGMCVWHGSTHVYKHISVLLLKCNCMSPSGPLHIHLHFHVIRGRKKADP